MASLTLSMAICLRKLIRIGSSSSYPIFSIIANSQRPVSNAGTARYFCTDQATPLRQGDTPTFGDFDPQYGVEFQKWGNGGGAIHKLADVHRTAVIEFGAIIHSRAHVGENAFVGSGAIVGPAVTVGVSTRLGYFFSAFMFT